MRLIDADALETRIRGLKTKVAASAAGAVSEDSYEQGAIDGLYDALSYLTEAPTVGGWVSVKDRLPHEGESDNEWLVLAIVSGVVNGIIHDHSPVVLVFSRYETPEGNVVTEWSDDDFKTVQTVHYWMEIPEPPEVKE